MIKVKSKEEIEKMEEGGRILAKIMNEIKKEAKPGKTTGELDSFAERLIREAGGKPSFKMVPRYHWATCMCVNEVVVHGIPNRYQLKEGDLLGIDVGMYYQGFHTDMAETIVVNHYNNIYYHSESLNDSNHLNKFIKVGWEALNQAVKMAKVGNRVGHISKAIEETITKAGFSPVRALVGHGIGRNLHEDPQIPCFLRGSLEKTAKLKIGMTLAIEVIYNQGKPEVVYKNDDGWTIKTKDSSLSGLFEHTVAILENGPKILTKIDQTELI